MRFLSNKQEVETLLKQIANDGVFFGAFAKRRRDGTVKHWNAKGLPDTFDDYDQERGLATVYDAKAGHPKSLALEGITEIRCYGETFKYVDDKLPL